MSGKLLNKFDRSNITLDNIDEINYIKEADVVYDLSFVENLVSNEFTEYNNLVCTVNKVLGKDNIVEDGILNVEEYSPTIFVGTDSGRFYKILKNNE